jgi:putative membrane protein
MRLAVAWDSHAFAIRRGRITRHLAAVPHARTQSVRFTQGPWERALDLASVHVDTTPGPVTISGLHLDRGFAADVCIAQTERARLARTRDTTVHWARYPIVTQP